MSAAGRVAWAGLQLLDRQLVDRHGRMAGKVDDLDLAEEAESGRLYVTAILSGPGVLGRRLWWPRLGAWVEAAHRRLAGGGTDPARIPFGRVSDIGSHLTLAVDADQLATAAGERWVRDHLVGHVPGSRHAAE